MKHLIKISCIIIFIIITITISINLYVIATTRKLILTSNNIDNPKNIDCILVLGAGIWDNKPSPMLKDRLDEAINLYQKGLASKIIMSGDHGQEDYDEVNIMKYYAISAGVPSEDIFMDHAGFSTYESIYRAKEIFNVKKAIIVTQKYHLYRALYIAKELGIESYGVGADPRKYSNQLIREGREALARNKDFFQVLLNIKPTYLGESIPVSGNGNITNDKDIEELKQGN
ncbi:MAG: vancomycin high temperature exclusion protein [Candidatus Coprovivens sp.]